MGGTQRRQHAGPVPDRGHHLDAVLGETFHRADCADSRGGPLTRQELPCSGNAPTAVRVVADVPRTGLEQRGTQRLGGRGGHEHHPFVQRGTDRGGVEHVFDHQSHGFGQSIGNSRPGGVSIGVRREERPAAADQPMDQRPLGRAGGDGVDAPEQQRVVRE